MTSHRPRRTPPDANQPGERAKLIALGYTCIDVHDLPGKTLVHGENPLDEFVYPPPGGSRVWVQVEWKTESGRKLFTPNEQWYFETLGIWDYVESGMLEPVAQWRQHGQFVVVAWTAEQIVDLFAEIDQAASLARQRANAAADGRRCSAMRGT